MGSDHFTLHANHPVSDNEHFVADLDEYRRDADQMLVIHIRFRVWNRSAYRRVTEEWWTLREYISLPIFAYGEHDDAKWEHFVTRLGFQYLSDIACTDGRTRRMFVSWKDAHALEDRNEHHHVPDG